MRDLLMKRLEASIAAVTSLRDQLDSIERVSTIIGNALRAGGTLYTAGNGGSAAEAMHLAEELIGRYRSNRQAYRAICLNADPTVLTCIANDFGYEQVFARQAEAMLREGDVLVVFSTSGMSANLCRLIETAQKRGATSLGLLGKDGGECAKLCDHSIVITSVDSAHIQEAHQVILHLICETLEASP